LISWLLLLALQQAGPAVAEEATPQPPLQPGTVVKGADLQLLSAVRGVARQVERLRGESFTRPPIAVRAPESIRDVAAEIRAYNVLTRERLEARGRCWDDVGLGGLRSPAVLFKTLATDLAGISYEPGGNRLLVSPDHLTLGDFAPTAEADDESSTVLMMTGVEPDEPLVGHLLMHVRQFERRGGDTLAPTTDQTLARSAWAEGEANLLAVRYLFAGMGLADDVMSFELDPRDLLSGSLFPVDLDRLSGVEGELVRFVYLDGFSQAVRRYRKGGWEALNAAMSRGDTTRDLLHPGSAPIRPQSFPPPVAPALEGLRLADQDSLGEQAILVLLSSWTGKDNLALQAADGWSGDRLYRWELAGDETPPEGITQWFTRWTSAQDAADFDYAIGRALEGRFPERPLQAVAPGVRMLGSPERVFRIERDGAEVQLWILPPELDAQLVGDDTVAPRPSN
jgi:hypothetical protein